MSKLYVSVEVIEDVKAYFKEHLPKYAVLKVRRKSYHPDDSYLYMVSAKRMMVHMQFGLVGTKLQRALTTGIMT